MTIPDGFKAVSNELPSKNDTTMRMRGYTDTISFSSACSSLPERLSFATNDETDSIYLWGDPAGRKRGGNVHGASNLGHKVLLQWIKKHWGEKWATIMPYADGWIAKVTNDRTS